MPELKTVCFCNEVSNREILHAIKRKNARSVEDVQKLTHAGKDCGRCKSVTRHILETELPKLKPDRQLRIDFDDKDTTKQRNQKRL
jgi:NAD(P)H-nitrite reductase large subunit